MMVMLVVLSNGRKRYKMKELEKYFNEKSKMKWYKSKTAARNRIEKLRKEGYVVEWGRLGKHFWVDIIKGGKNE